MECVVILKGFFSLWPLTIHAASPKNPILILWDVDVSGWCCDDRLAICTTFVPVLFSGSSGLLGAGRSIRFLDGGSTVFHEFFSSVFGLCFMIFSVEDGWNWRGRYGSVVVFRDFCGSRCCFFSFFFSLFVRGKGRWRCWWWFSHDLCLLLILNLVFPELRSGS